MPPVIPSHLEQIFDFLDAIEPLKSTLRRVWTATGRTESTAEHSWRLAVMAIVTAKELELELDTHRAIQIALMHDLAEAITGDIDAIRIAEGKFSRAEKERLEIQAIEVLSKKLAPAIGNEIVGLWNEYNSCQTPEARFIKALDKIETLSQLAEGGFQHFDKPVFLPNYANPAVKNFPPLLPMLKIVKRKLKEEFQKGGIPWKKEYDSFE